MSSVIIADEAMHSLYAEIDRIAATGAPILLLGEAGTGKDVIAETIHARSARSENAFLRLNCGRLGPRALAAELFGHEQGANEGALRRKQGILELAFGGTVYIEEIDRLPLPLQAQLAVALAADQVVRAGEDEPRAINVRVVTASAVALDGLIEPGQFRGDLFAMLSSVTLRIPPLRERPGEILPLAMRFASELASVRYARPPLFSAEACEVLLGHAWPGNIRELRSVIEHAVIECAGEIVEPAHLAIAQRQR